MLDLRRLRLLRELKRLGTISAVADALRYSPSAVSQQLATLERETGVRLLEPAGRRVRLTAQAELLVEHAGRLLEEMERAEAALARSLEDTVGTLRVAAFQTAVLTLLPGTLLSLADQHPGLRVEVAELEPEVALPALVAGDFDLVLGEEYPGHPLRRPRETERYDLFADELGLAIPTAWRERSLSALRRRAFVLEPPGTTAHEWALGTCRNAGFEPDVRYVSTDLQIHLTFVEHGLASALVPDLAGAAGRPEITLRRLPDGPHRVVFAAVRRGSIEQPSISAFRRSLEAVQRKSIRQSS